MRRNTTTQLHASMRIGSEQWLALVINGAAQLGAEVHPTQAKLLASHCQLLLEWNRKVNLTAITDPKEMAVKHVLDALAAIAHIPKQGPLLDIGTGGGFPGIPLKVLRPDQSMTLIDGSRKKISFVKHIIRQLRLTDIQALQVRAEDLKTHAGAVQGFRVVVCRALGSLQDVIQLASPLLLPNGSIVALKGPGETHCDGTKFNQAINGHKKTEADRYFHAVRYSYRLPFLGDARSLFVIQ